MTIFAFLFTLTILVFIHEMGHYLVAKYHGVQVDVFSIGFGYTLIKKRMFNTEWRISLIPIGGYVKMHGDLIPQEQKKTKMATNSKSGDFKVIDDNTLESKSLWQKSQIVIAGPLANVLLTFFLLWGITTFFGVPERGDITVHGFSQIIPDTPAMKAGFQANDIPLSANGKRINNFEDLRSITQESKGKPIEFILLRNNKTITASLTPEYLKDSDKFIVGVVDAINYNKSSFIDGLLKSIEQTYNYGLLILNGLSDLISNVNLDQVGGPIQIAQMSSQALSNGVLSYMNFLALFSVNLAILNLLPIPGLDGGYLLGYAITKVFGTKVGNITFRYGIPVGISLLLILMVGLIYLDLAKLFGLS